MPSGAAPAEALLFVYGTLTRAAGGEPLMAGCRFLRRLAVPGELHDIGEYPALVLSGGSRVHGELWRCTTETLDRLDAYEGVDEGLFERTQIEVDEGPCWTYTAGRALQPHLSTSTLIPAGRWPRGL